MGTDLNKDYKDIKSKIQAYKTTTDSKKNFLQSIKDNAGDNFEKPKKDTFSKLNEWGDTVDGMTANKKKQLQGQVTTQLDQLTEVFMISAKSGVGDAKSIDKLVSIYNDTIINTRERIRELFIKETISALGCSEEQTFTTSPLYIRVQSVDIFRKLFEDADGEVSELLYEKDTTPNGIFPYSMNKELYNRIQNKGVSFDSEYGSNYVGASNNPIMNITYVDQDNNGNLGDYFKVELNNRPNSANSVAQFLQDYYMSIQMVDIDELVTIIIDNLMGAISFNLSVDIGRKEQQNKFSRILQRCLGLCFDTNKEIDVSGISKVSALDNIDDSFFEFTDTELRNIEEEMENFTKGLVEFTDCNNVKLPLSDNDIQAIIKYTKDARNKNSLSDKLAGVVETVNKASENEEWKLLLPTLNINASMKFDLLGIIPKGIMQLLLSPKNLLGFMVMFKAIQNNVVDLVEDITTFLQNFRKFIVEIMSKLGAIFVEELFMSIKENLNELVRIIITDIAKEAKDARARMIFTVLEILIVVSDGLQDWRRCKSVIDELFQLLQIAARNLNVGLPPFVLSLSRLLPGMSETRVFANYVNELQKSGIPTGDLPDGSPNIGLMAVMSQVKGQFKEMHENGKTEVTIDPISVLGSTTGQIKAHGKSY